MPARRVSSEAKKRNGTYNSSRENPNEPIVKKSRPTMPQGLATSAKRYWTKVSDFLEAMGVLTAYDAFAVLSLALALSDREEARKVLTKEGWTYSINGQVKKHPMVDIANTADEKVYKWLTKTGLTPADRATLSAIVEKDEGPALDLDALKG